VYIKIKCEHSILLHSVNCGYDNVLDTVICWPHCILDICLVLLFFRIL